jgi:uncharacterized OB-fold protein
MELASMPERPGPIVTPETAEYWAAGHRGVLLIGSCEICGHIFFPPRAVCPRCWESGAGSTASSGRGSVYAYSVVHQNRNPGFRDNLPYVVALVELDEGVQLMTNLVDCDPNEVRVAMPVGVVFQPLDDRVSIPLFRPVTP